MDEINGWRNNEVRSALEGLQRDAEKQQFAIILLAAGYARASVSLGGGRLGRG
jgi:hypothetical protein